ncbi:MAG: DUF4328 domain-containing protein [Pseudomonadota bacterium]
MPYQNGRLADWCIGLTWFYVLASVFWIVVWVIEIVLEYDPILGPVDLTDGVSGALEALLALVMFGAIIGSLITFILNAVWLYRAAANANALDPDSRRIGPGWTIGWWFIPIANLWMPFRAVKQIWNTTVGSVDILSPAPGFFGFWWAAWIIGDLLSNVSFRLTMDDTWDSYRSSLWFDAASGPLNIAAAIMFIRIIRGVNEAERSRASTADIFD